MASSFSPRAPRPSSQPTRLEAGFTPGELRALVTALYHIDVRNPAVSANADDLFRLRDEALVAFQRANPTLVK